MRDGICGKEFSKYVIELNRLVIVRQVKNSASFLISRSIKLLPKPLIIVSYADTSMNHNGYVYQASNFIYTGLSAKRTDWKIKGLENLHGQTIADLSRGYDDRAKFMREKYGENFYLEDRPRKHRYIYFHANNYYKKSFKKNLKYNIIPYPKSESKKYKTEDKVSTNLILF